jgi:leader peptidase (prepilin peptidase)/N-methyltransferase
LLSVAVLPPEQLTRVTEIAATSKSINRTACWTGCLYAILALPQFFSGSGMAPAEVLVSVLLGVSLVALSAIDLHTLRLPDIITLPLAVAGLLLAALLGWEPSFAWRIAGAVGGFACIWGLNEAFRAVRGYAGMGLGDAKLLAVAGAWLGPMALPSTLLYACAGALLLVAFKYAAGRAVGGREPLPFGPFLAAAIWLVWLYGPLV